MTCLPIRPQKAIRMLAPKEEVMTANMGNADRAVRIVIGLLLIAFAIPVGFPDTGWNWLGWIGIVPILTAVIGNCPAYSVLGFSTRR
jgi:hypothetical protein